MTDKQLMQQEMEKLQGMKREESFSRSVRMQGASGKKTGEPILTVSLADVMKAKKEGKAIR